MLKVKTTLGPSLIHGLGLFADEFIPKGTCIFEEDKYFTIKIPASEFDNLSELQQEFLHHFGYLQKGVWHCSLDNDRFLNHSDTPNTYESNNCTIASQDIMRGEEITLNYEDVCETFTA